MDKTARILFICLSVALAAGVGYYWTLYISKFRMGLTFTAFLLVERYGNSVNLFLHLFQKSE